MARCLSFAAFRSFVAPRGLRGTSADRPDGDGDWRLEYRQTEYFVRFVKLDHIV
jgi:hypothetical protein